MLDRESCERRVYRLATLLTGNPNAAVKVIQAVVDAQPDLRKLDDSHMDRLTVLRSREIKAGAIVSKLVPLKIAQALANLAPQQREAWVFMHVYKIPLRDMSKAMDCSTTATERHIDQATTELTEKLGTQSNEAGQILLSYSMTLHVPEFYRANQRRKRRMKWFYRVAAALFILVAIIAGLSWWLESSGKLLG